MAISGVINSTQMHAQRGSKSVWPLPATSDQPQVKQLRSKPFLITGNSTNQVSLVQLPLLSVKDNRKKNNNNKAGHVKKKKLLGICLDNAKNLNHTK